MSSEDLPKRAKLPSAPLHPAVPVRPSQGCSPEPGETSPPHPVTVAHVDARRASVRRAPGRTRPRRLPGPEQEPERGNLPHREGRPAPRRPSGHDLPAVGRQAPGQVHAQVIARFLELQPETTGSERRRALLAAPGRAVRRQSPSARRCTYRPVPGPGEGPACGRPCVEGSGRPRGCRGTGARRARRARGRRHADRLQHAARDTAGLLSDRDQRTTAGDGVRPPAGGRREGLPAQPFAAGGGKRLVGHSGGALAPVVDAVGRQADRPPVGDADDGDASVHACWSWFRTGRTNMCREQGSTITSARTWCRFPARGLVHWPRKPWSIWASSPGSISSRRTVTRDWLTSSGSVACTRRGTRRSTLQLVLVPQPLVDRGDRHRSRQVLDAGAVLVDVGPR